MITKPKYSQTSSNITNLGLWEKHSSIHVFVQIIVIGHINNY